MEDRQANTPGRSKVKRRGSTGGTLKRHKFVSQDRLDESSFGKFFIYLIYIHSLWSEVLTTYENIFTVRNENLSYI